MDIPFLIAQVVALLCCAVSCASYLAKKRRYFLCWQLVNNVLYGTQYALLGAFAGVASNTVSIAKYAIFIHNNSKGKDNSKAELLVFLVLSFGMGLFFLDGWYTAVPIVTSLLFTFAAWQKSEKLLRVIGIVCCALWIWYNLLVRAYISATYSFVELLCALVTLIKRK